ncbi:MAG: hypothetical protein QOF28_1733, partial [Actinomycetota bacterium]|nr:hypothetical protein [Actinomycetota bacterium]
ERIAHEVGAENFGPVRLVADVGEYM